MSDDEDRTGGGGRGGGTLNTIHKDAANRRLKFLQAALTTLECVPRVERLRETLSNGVFTHAARGNLPTY